ncbi:MAG: sulfatase-like hydrolase/transferase [Anaerovoracaceae bacterium]|nr:sulfatase-like hydrolase/transferase [Anaerovoracaceae bacterium]
MNNERDNRPEKDNSQPRKFDKFEKLDRKVEETINEVETMGRKKLAVKFFHTSFAIGAIWAIALNLIIETLGRAPTTSIWGGIEFFFENPIVFLYNALIIYATLVIASIFRRRVFVFTLVTLFWLVIGIANGVILTQRMTPFTVKDLSILEDGITIVTNYMSTFQIVMIAAGAVIAIGLLVLLFIKGPKKKGEVKRKRNIIGVVLVIAMTFAVTTGMIRTEKVETFFGNLAYAYRDYGVVYCFVNTWLNTGISKPSGYDEEMMLSIFNEEELGDDNAMLLESKDVDEQYPNILFLQLESFIDPSHITSIELSEDACPNFRQLLADYPSGKLTVPACGAGTANVEFEVMSGLSVKFFGPGEYPYKSVLTEKTMETLGYDLKSLGYSTHAIHNHRAVFYNRNSVFANMGMDTFTSIEYMNDVEKTPKNWAKDNVLVGCITDALESTESRDMIYTISVQGHGKYPTEQVIEDPEITVTSAPSESIKWRYEYYVNQVYEMDQFIGDLTERLSEYDEPVVLVMYGDHIPAIDITESDLEDGDLYGTEYVIWSNFGLDGNDEDMYTYQLASHLMEMLDMQVGTVFTYQQNHKNSETYLDDLKAIGYDILYGDYYLYGGENPFEPTDMKMGVKDIKIEEIVQIGDKYYIKGQNFTEYSKITLNGKELKTIYLGTNILGVLEDVDPDDVDDMKVSQIETKSSEILSTTE